MLPPMGPARLKCLRVVNSKSQLHLCCIIRLIKGKLSAVNPFQTCDLHVSQDASSLLQLTPTCKGWRCGPSRSAPCGSVFCLKTVLLFPLHWVTSLRFLPGNRLPDTLCWLAHRDVSQNYKVGSVICRFLLAMQRFLSAVEGRLFKRQFGILWLIAAPLTPDDFGFILWTSFLLCTDIQAIWPGTRL